MLLERKGKMKTAGESSVPRAASKPPLVRPHATFRPPPGASREELERFIDILVEQILDLRKDNADLMEMLKKDMENQEDLRRDKEDMRRDMRKDKEMLWKVIEDLGKDKDYLRNELKRERAFSLKLSKKAATRCAVSSPANSPLKPQDPIFWRGLFIGCGSAFLSAVVGAIINRCQIGVLCKASQQSGSLSPTSDEAAADTPQHDGG
ncbi:unnamed protein product [Vitrella brassicaformis CCMP3155]|uniref:Uncharacterized protein n=1 Tax=Vitrella brassicaformis (strain CCMP3155) TaxID=1169540 RepID=A0A0G4EFQ5_VITBC|nr:unnamed protein product [Vitrella brassicaformis CCMP3155]|eukprot:CEL94234.1 unnamed protein product [Vitrella brassicaformis CCMP3155]